MVSIYSSIVCIPDSYRQKIHYKPREGTGYRVDMDQQVHCSLGFSGLSSQMCQSHDKEDGLGLSLTYTMT